MPAYGFALFMKASSKAFFNRVDALKVASGKYLAAIPETQMDLFAAGPVNEA